MYITRMDISAVVFFVKTWFIIKSTIYYESFEAEKLRGFHGLLRVRETF